MKISAIFSITLFAVSALAAPHSNGGHARRIVRRTAREIRTTNPLKVIGSTDALPDTNATEVEYSSNWAGAVLTAPPADETFNSVSGQFVVPTPSIPQDGRDGKYSAAIWVGIDGDTYGNAIWQSGIDISVSGSQISFDVWYEWFPSPSCDIQGFSISVGDIIIITVSDRLGEEGGWAKLLELKSRHIRCEPRYYTSHFPRPQVLFASPLRSTFLRAIMLR